MYIQPQGDELRQGDVLEKVWFSPAAFHRLKDGQITIPQVTLKSAHLVVVSHCCELGWYESSPGIKVPRRPYVLVAPLSLKMPFDEGSEAYRMLIENGRNKPENDPVQFYYYEVNSSIGAEAVIDFSSITPIKSTVLRDLELQRLLELDVRHRHLFRTKLQAYFSRVPAEEWDEVGRIMAEEAKSAQ